MTTPAVHVRPPAGSVDCHAHVFGPYARFPLAAGRRYSPPEASVDDYLAMLDRVGLARAVLVQGSPHGTDNAVLVDALARDPRRLRGIAVVEHEVSTATLERLDRAGVRGVRISDALQWSPLLHLESLARRVAPLGWHVQVHVERSDDFAALAPRLRALPVPVVVDHMAGVTGEEGPGAPGFRALLDLVAGHDHVWVKAAAFYHRSPAGFPYPDMQAFARAIVDARPDRVLFGTNWPHPARGHVPPADETLLDALAQWFPDPRTRQRILVDNPEQLFGFAPLTA